MVATWFLGICGTQLLTCHLAWLESVLTAPLQSRSSYAVLGGSDDQEHLIAALKRLQKFHKKREADRTDPQRSSVLYFSGQNGIGNLSSTFELEPDIASRSRRDNQQMFLESTLASDCFSLLGC